MVRNMGTPKAFVLVRFTLLYCHYCTVCDNVNQNAVFGCEMWLYQAIYCRPTCGGFICKLNLVQKRNTFCHLSMKLQYFP